MLYLEEFQGGSETTYNYVSCHFYHSCVVEDSLYMCPTPGMNSYTPYASP